MDTPLILPNIIYQWFHEIISSEQWADKYPEFRVEYNSETTRIGWDIKYINILHHNPTLRVPVLKLQFSASSLIIRSYGMLQEDVTYDLEKNTVDFSKWGNDAALEVADPLFFDKLAYMIDKVGLILSMGGISPLVRLIQKNEHETKKQDETGMVQERGG